MINTDQSDYLHVLSNVTKYLALILKESNGLKVYAQYESDLDTQSLQYADANHGKEILLSESVCKTLCEKKQLILENFKSIILRKYEALNEKRIYDQIHEELKNDEDAGTVNVINTSIHNHMNSMGFYSTANDESSLASQAFNPEISILDKLKITQSIWYLPNFNRSKIKKILKDKETGNFIINEKKNATVESPRNSPQLSQPQLVLFVLITKNLKVMEYPIKLNRKNLCYYFPHNKSLEFKSIYYLLEHFILDSPISENIKLSLPKVIIDTNSLQQLDFFSSLKQDFWHCDLHIFSPNSTSSSVLKEYYSSEFKPKSPKKLLKFLQNSGTLGEPDQPFTDSSFSTTSVNSQYSLNQYSASVSPSPNLKLFKKPDEINNKKRKSFSVIQNSNSSIFNSEEKAIVNKRSANSSKHKTKPIEIKNLNHQNSEVASESAAFRDKVVQPSTTSRSNFNRFLFRRRFRSKSLDQLPTLKTNKSKKVFLKKKKIPRQKFFYDPRFNKLPRTKANSSYFPTSSYSSASSTFSRSSSDSNISASSNSLLSKLWPLPKYISNKFKVKPNKPVFDDSKPSSPKPTNQQINQDIIPTKSTNQKKSIGYFFLSLFHNSPKPLKEIKSPQSDDTSNWSETNKTFSSTNQETSNFDTLSVNSINTLYLTESDSKPPPLPLTPPPQILSDNSTESKEKMVNLFKKPKGLSPPVANPVKNSSSNSSSNCSTSSSQTPLQIKKFLNNIGSPKFLTKNKGYIQKECTESFTELQSNNSKFKSNVTFANVLGFENKKKTELAFRVSNEYSEPFDVLSLNKPTSNEQLKTIQVDKGQQISSCQRIETGSIADNQINEQKKSNFNYLDEDSAYNSYYNSQSPSSMSPRALTEIKNSKSQKDSNNSQILSPRSQSAQTYVQEYNFDTEEESSFDICGINSSSSASSSPISPFYDQPQSPLQQSKLKQNIATKSPTLPVLSEYEAVKDSLVTLKIKSDLNVETNNESNKDEICTLEDCEKGQNFNQETFLKNNPFDNLSTRCAKIIGIYDESSSIESSTKPMNYLKHYNSVPRRFGLSQTEKSRQLQKFINLSHQNSTLKKKISTYDSNVVDYRSLNRQNTHAKPGYSSFIDRTLTFKNLISFSSILNSSNESPRNFLTIRNFILDLSQDTQGLFGKSIKEFINCVNTSVQLNPNILMGNTRQFMNGIKNYLIKNNVQDLNSLLEQERMCLSNSECLNIDSVLEDCLQSILLRPLKAKIYYLLVDWLIKDGSLEKISRNIKKINCLEEVKCVSYLALHKVEHRPNFNTLNTIKIYYYRMQCEYAPLVKLKYILYIINELLLSHKDFSCAITDLGNLNVISFLPVVIYTICKACMSAIQIEIDYIWSLAYRNLLTNECIYYLTLMSSACFILKSLENKKQSHSRMSKFLGKETSSLHTVNNLFNKQTPPVFSYMESGLIDIYLPDDNYQMFKIKTIPVKPNSKCKDVNTTIAAKFKIFNSSEYALYFLENGVENKLSEEDQPLEIKIEKIKKGSRIKFIFKKKNDNLLWSNRLQGEKA